MSFESILQKLSMVAAADLSAKQYYGVKATSTGANLAGDGEKGLGILQNKPEAGHTAEIACYGITKAVAAEVIAVDADVAFDANGKLVNAATGDYIFGTALEAAAADGDIIAVLILHAGVSD